jgi:hypothetical protein
MLLHKGEDFIVADGTTLLGADDKAGIAEIMTAVEYLLAHPEVKHGVIKIAFTPDEEVGQGVDRFDVAKFGAKYAYTLDGDELGSLEYENFNGASAEFEIVGKSIHPGTAKGIMKNAALIAAQLTTLFPSDETPRSTEKYEGFFHLTSIKGVCEKAEAKYIIRDHDKHRFEQRKSMTHAICDFLNAKYGEGTVTVHVRDSYYNMREVIEQNMMLIDIARGVMEKLGIPPLVKPVRGGTDGARLSYMGLPCPNLFTGGRNYHGPLEYVVIQSMEKAVQVIGHPVVHLWLRSDASDLDVFAYLEEVDGNGNSTYITEGNLRASHRASGQAPYDNLGLPYHDHFQRELKPIQAGEPFELVFDMLPTAHQFSKGGRIRMAIAFADADNFDTPVIEPAPKLDLLRDRNHPSSVQLPVAQ